MTGLIHKIVILVAVVWPGNEGSAPHMLCYLDGDHLQCSSRITNHDRRRLGFTPTKEIEDRIMTGVTTEEDQVPAGTFLTENQVLPPIFNKVIKIKRLVRKKINSLLVPPSTNPESNTISTTQDSLSKLANHAKLKLAKLLSIFTVVNFNNDGCATTEGLKGTCYHNLECRSLGGIPSGLCAAGYGICCLFSRTCGERTSTNCTYFEGPATTTGTGSGPLGCLLTVDKATRDVVQLRLEFVAFELDQPTNGSCITEQFLVTGQNTNIIVPVLCGSNTGQHVYVDVTENNGPYQLSVIRSTSGSSRFRIKVTQVRKGDLLEAPTNCLQYYLGPSGQISSFNYLEEGGSGYLNSNLNYAICFRKETGFCTMTYFNERNGQEYPFQITNLAGGEMLVPPGQAGAEVFNCPDSYFIINGIRLCGEKLNDASTELDFTKNAPVTDTSNGPFILPVRLAGETNGRGFKLDFQQNPCL